MMPSVQPAAPLDFSAPEDLAPPPPPPQPDLAEGDDPNGNGNSGGDHGGGNGGSGGFSFGQCSPSNPCPSGQLCVPIFGVPTCV